MDRRDCEKIILEKLKDIVAIYHEYNPEGEYLTLEYMVNKEFGPCFYFNNAYFEKDSEFPIRYSTISGSF